MIWYMACGMDVAMLDAYIVLVCFVCEWLMLNHSGCPHLHSLISLVLLRCMCLCLCQCLCLLLHVSCASPNCICMSQHACSWPRRVMSRLLTSSSRYVCMNVVSTHVIHTPHINTHTVRMAQRSAHLHMSTFHLSRT